MTGVTAGGGGAAAGGASGGGAAAAGGVAAGAGAAGAGSGVAATGSAGGAVAAAGGSGAGGGGAAAPDSMKPRMSFFVTRPPVPVPGTTDGSIPCSAAIRATTGETNVLPFPAAEAVAVASRCGSGLGRRRRRCDGRSEVRLGRGRGRLRDGRRLGDGCDGLGERRRLGDSRGNGLGGGGLRGSDAAPAGAMRARTVPTSTVSPSWTRISATTPSPGLGTSVSTLSVEISRSGSSRPIASPTCLSHLVTVPSETDTPIWGITTSVCVPVDTIPPSRRRALSGRWRRLRPVGCMPSRAAAQTARACPGP